MLGVPFGEVLGVGIQAERAGDLREHHRRRGQAEQGETGVRRIEVGREFAGGLSLAEVGEHALEPCELPLLVLPVGVAVDAFADQQPEQIGLCHRRLCVGGNDLAQRAGVRGDGRLTGPPALGDGAIETFLATEVVRDQLLVDTGPPGDLADSRAAEAVRAELCHRRVQQLLPASLGVAPALIRPWGSPHSAHRSGAAIRRANLIIQMVD